MKTRIKSGLIMVPLLIFVILGGPLLTAICFLFGIMAVKEFFNGFQTIGIKPSFSVAVISALLLYGIYYVMEARGDIYNIIPLMMSWFFIVTVVCLLYLFDINNRQLADAMATITGIIYIIYFASHIVLIDMQFSHGGKQQLLDFPISGFMNNPVWLVFITAFCTDIFAYFTGVIFGKHKLCPEISPKKTIEGAAGGVIGTVIVSALFGYFCLIPSQLAVWVAIGLIGSIASMFGDLTASIFKRKMGIKDYGKLIPGHGGVLDRIDSVLFTAPVVYYCLMLFKLVYVD